MRSWIRVLAVACALLMVALAFQTIGAQANTPTSANEFNHALASNLGTATASGSSGTNTPGKAIDGISSTYWMSSSTTGSLAVAFSPRAYINEVHIHFLAGSTIYPSLSLYVDANANGAYDTNEKLWSVAKNGVRDVVASFATANALSMKLTINSKVGASHPKIAEFEAYLRGDSDGDGLTNTQETSTIYFQDMGAGDLPATVPDDATSYAAATSSLVQFYGYPVVGLANFTVDHARKTDLTAQVGYWNGSAWIDRYVWDPGHHLDKVTITQPAANTYLDGTVSLVATVDHPEVTSKVEFRVRGVLQATVTVPVGNEYRWSWNAAAFSEGPAALNATQYDFAGGKAWSEINVNVNRAPQTTWVSPANGATVSDAVTIQVTATDGYGIRFVDFYVDGTFKAQLTSPNAGVNGYALSWSTSGYCSNTQHTLKVVVTENSPQYLTSSPAVTVTANTYPLVCITNPTNGATVRGTVSVVASPTPASGKSITKVAFYLLGSLVYTATASPWAWSWDTSLAGDGQYTVSVIATDSASKTASSSVTFRVSNGAGGGGCTRPPCPVSVTGGVPSKSVQGTTLIPEAAAAPAAPSGSQPALTLGVLTTPWKLGEVDVGTQSTVVVDLVNPQSGASAAESSAHIIRPAFPAAYFMTYLLWHVVIRDWNNLVDCVPHGDPACVVTPPPGQVLTFTLRFEAASDPYKADTDGDGIPDGTEVSVRGTLPVARDSDADGLSDDYELAPHTLVLTVNGVATTLPAFTTDPTKFDSDGDGLGDGEERSLGIDRTVTNPLSNDTDGDGLWDGLTIGTHPGELSYGANATRTDTDGDTIPDWTEVNPRELQLTINDARTTRSVVTLPYSTDSDGDGLRDELEWSGTSAYGVITDPSDSDTDRDGLADGQERYMKEVAMPTRKTIGVFFFSVAFSTSQSLTVRLSGTVERVTLSYGLSGIDVSNFELSVTHGVDTFPVRYRQGSGLFNFSSIDLPSYMWGGGTYSLSTYSPVWGGILEKYSILFTIRTSPIRADSDIDGINDAEEITYGQDGWITDPNLADTDGDTLSDAAEISRSMSPLSVDTDADGALDNVDLDPLHNLLVKVTVNRIHHGDPWCTPTLLGIVRVNDAYSWVTEHRGAALDPFISVLCPVGVPTVRYSTSDFGLSYYADVPDDVNSVTIQVAAWSINSGRGDDLIVNGLETYRVNSGLWGYVASNGNHWVTYEVSTVALAKAKTLLVTDGEVTITSTAGQTRMAGPDRFFVFTLVLTAASPPFVSGVNTVLVPRSVFLDSKLKADFGVGTCDPLCDAPLYGQDLSTASISDGVAGVVAKSLTADQASNILNRLLMDTSGSVTHSYVDVTSQVLAANLPLDVVRIVAWSSVTSGPIGDMPQTFWQKVGAAMTTVVNTLVYMGQLIYKGLVALATFIADLAQAIVDWGMKFAGAVSVAAAAVVGAIGDALAKLWEWALSVIQGMLAPLVQAIKGPIRDEGVTLTASTVPANAISNPVERRGFLESLWDMIGSGNFFNLVVAFVLAAQVVAAIAANVIFPGAGSLVVAAIESIIIGLLIGFVIAAIVDTVLMGLDAIFKAAIPASDRFWAEGAGLDTLGVITDLTHLLLSWNKNAKPGFRAFKTLPMDAKWLALSLAGLGITLASAQWHGSSAIAASVIGLGLSAVGTIMTFENDVFDNMPFPAAPLKYTEEALALASLGYSMKDFADTVARERLA